MPQKNLEKKGNGAKQNGSEHKPSARAKTAVKKTSGFKIGGEVVILLLVIIAILSVVGWFSEAPVLTFINRMLEYAFGAGFVFAPLSIIVLSLYLTINLNKEKKAGKIAALCALPLLMGVFAQLIYSPITDIGLPKLIAGLLSSWISRVGAIIVLSLIILLTVFALLGITLSGIFAYLRRKLERAARLKLERDARRAEERERRLIAEEARRAELDQKAKKVEKLPASNFPIDIKLDDYKPQPQGAFSMPDMTDFKPKKKANIDIPMDDEEAFFAQNAQDAYPNPKPTAPAAKKPRPESMSPEEIESEISKIGEQQSLLVKREYAFPPLELLKEPDPLSQADVESEIRNNASKLVHTLMSFGIEAKIINITRGPTVTRYEVRLPSGIKYSKLASLSDDLALALAAQTVRIARIMDESAVGIEVPNKVTNIVRIREVISSKEFIEGRSKVTFALGKDIAGKPVVGDIARLPHLLVAGTTGSGKSVCINTLLISLLYKASPDDLKFIMIDPKMVELIAYNRIPHLLIPVVTDPKKAAGALQWAVMEMMSRYKKFNENSVRNFTDYNAEAERREREYDYETEDEDGTSPPRLEKLPRIVIVVDELADLMLAAPTEVEESICRISQMARAAGMHLIIATQRPSADVITGLMKANIPSRISFAVASALESRIILDQMGAEKLLGKGDMLFNPLGATKPTRVQGCLITDEEIESVVSFVRAEAEAEYSEEVSRQIEKNAQENEKGKKGSGGYSAEDQSRDELDELFFEAGDIVFDAGQVSVSMLQRRLKLGYNRAGRLVDQMEELGIVGPFEGSKPRSLLMTKEEWQEFKYSRMGGSSENT